MLANGIRMIHLRNRLKPRDCYEIFLRKGERVPTGLDVQGDVKGPHVVLMNRSFLHAGGTIAKVPFPAGCETCAAPEQVSLASGQQFHIEIDVGWCLRGARRFAFDRIGQPGMQPSSQTSTA